MALTEAEKKQRKREWYLKNRDKVLPKAKENAKKRYNENKNIILERNKKWKERNPEYMLEYRDEHKEEIKEYNKEYSKTPRGRANNLLSSYRSNDIKHNRGECKITVDWILDNILFEPCIYCGEKGWEIIGCDRKDNKLPHTPDNCVPCCLSCNSKKGSMNYEEFKKMLGEENS